MRVRSRDGKNLGPGDARAFPASPAPCPVPFSLSRLHVQEQSDLSPTAGPQIGGGRVPEAPLEEELPVNQKHPLWTLHCEKQTFIMSELLCDLGLVSYSSWCFIIEYMLIYLIPTVFFFLTTEDILYPSQFFHLKYTTNIVLQLRRYLRIQRAPMFHTLLLPLTGMFLS